VGLPFLKSLSICSAGIFFVPNDLRRVLGVFFYSIFAALG